MHKNILLVLPCHKQYKKQQGSAFLVVILSTALIMMVMMGVLQLVAQYKLMISDRQKSLQHYYIAQSLYHYLVLADLAIAENSAQKKVLFDGIWGIQKGLYFTARAILNSRNNGSILTVQLFNQEGQEMCTFSYPYKEF